MNQSASVSAAPNTMPLAVRVIRAAVIASLSLAFTVLILLALAATTPLVRASIAPLVSEHAFVSVTAAAVIVIAVLSAPLVVLTRLARRGLLRWPHLTVLSAIVVSAFAYLMWDDAIVRRPLTMDELAPLLPGDETTHAMVIRYGKDSSATKAYRPSEKFHVAAASPKDGERWTKHLQEHRAEIEAGWRELQPIREWWDELSRQSRLGDATAPRVDATILAFQPVRSYSQYAIAVAGLKALDGAGDEAADMMIRLFDVARKLEPNSRTLVRSMIAKVIQRMAIESSGFILDRSTVSPAKRAELVSCLSAAVAGPAGVRRLVLIEYAYFQPILNSYLGGHTEVLGQGDRFVQRAAARLSRVVINPRATQNFVGDRYYRLAECAADRRLADFEANTSAIDRSMGGYHIKNLGGRLFADMAMPAFSKVVKAYWDIEDARLALIARLQKT